MPGDDTTCIRCGRCLTVCPLVRVTGREELAPRAKAMLLEALDKGGTVAPLDAERLASLCLGCHRCRDVCPQGVDAPAAVSALRAAHPDFKTWLWKAFLRKPEAAMPLAGLAPKGWTPPQLDLAGLKPPTEGPWVEITRFPTCFQGRKTVLFAGCAGTGLVKRWSRKARGMLEALGVDLLKADFGCCGLPQESAGLLHEAGESRRAVAERWVKLGEPTIATICATCRKGLIDAARDLGGEQGERMEQAVTPLSAMLAISETRLTPAAPERAVLHRPCHETSLADEALLRMALGDRLIAPAESKCCGFGGALRLARPDLSQAVGRRCWENLTESGAQNALAGCTACAMALASSAPEGARAFHWLDIFS